MPHSVSLPVPWLSAVASVMAMGEEGKKKQMMKRLIPGLLFFITWNTVPAAIVFYFIKGKEKSLQRWNMGLSLHWSSQFLGGWLRRLLFFTNA